MARSIHTTRKSVRALVRRKRAEEAIDEKKIEGAAKELQRKRRIKLMVRAERKETPKPVAPMDIEMIPIEVRDEGPLEGLGLGIRSRLWSSIRG